MIVKTKYMRYNVLVVVIKKLLKKSLGIIGGVRVLKKLFQKQVNSNQLKQKQLDPIQLEQQYNKKKLEYINFLKKNHAWSKDLEEKYNPKDLKHPLRMETFNEDFVLRYVRSKINKGNFNKNSKVSYGYEKLEAFNFNLKLMETIEELCRVNKWTTPKDWKKHGLDMAKYMKNFIAASTARAEVMMYYAKREYDQRQSIHKGR